jgi:hypothetical protein
MADDVTREEFDHLRTRVDIAEREIDGEKLVTRHILEQTRHNGDDLAAIKSRLGRIEENLTGVDLKALVRTVGDLDRKVDGLDRRIDDLTRALPRIVGDALKVANSVAVIEHNLEVIKTADWIIDLGPEGGDGGGEIVAVGPPEAIVKEKRSYTGRFLREVLERRPQRGKKGGARVEAAE